PRAQDRWPRAGSCGRSSTQERTRRSPRPPPFSSPSAPPTAATGSPTCSAMRSASAVSGTASEPTWSAGGEGEQLWFLGTLAIVRVPGEAVDGRFSLLELVMPRHASPALHTHPQDESYVVLEGLLTVKAGSK